MNWIKPKWLEASLKGGSLHTGGAKTEKELGCTPIEQEVYKKTHVRKKENESDPDNDFHKYVAENLDSSVQLTPELSTQIWKEKVVGRHTRVDAMSGLEDIGSSRQAEALDGVQIVAMSDQIAKITVALAESERKRVAEQESMSENSSANQRASDEPRSSTYYFGSR
ncbi:hypothetical protein H5410_050786 [Solanum commersonii]|uniref:Uncharacterized protein n=1 Tax=Solanum commersonii TaxID=4109 RepID=A0A9J5WXS4_SOLCO|nr:hypothetical protein H5410_050786 [Solanum commersonii]